MTFRPEIWWPIGGLCVFAVLAFSIYAGLSLHPKLDGWVAWLFAALGCVCTGAAGMYLARDTWLFKLFGFFADIHPAVAFIMALIGLGLAGVIPAAVVPERWSSKIGLTSGIAVALLILPTLTLTALPQRGSVWVSTRATVTDVGDSMVDVTQGWFW